MQIFHWFSRFTLLVGLVLIWWGAAVTTEDVGLAVPDWPLAFGKINSILATTFKYTTKMPYELTLLSSEIHYYSSAKSRDELGLPQTPIEFAIKDCFEWFLENGYLEK